MPHVVTSLRALRAVVSLLLGGILVSTTLSRPHVSADFQEQACACEVRRVTCPDGVVPISVRLRWLKTAQFAGYFSAERLGYWSDECLEVTLLPAVLESTVLDLQGAQIGIPWYLDFLHEVVRKKQDLLHVSQVFTRPGWRWWTSPVYEREKTIGVRGFGDLRGLSLSTYGSVSSLLLHSLIEKHGMSSCGDMDPHTGVLMECRGDEDITLKRAVSFGAEPVVGGDRNGVQAHAMFGVIYDQVGEVLLRGLDLTGGKTWTIGPAEQGGDFDVFDPATQDGLRLPEDGVMVNRTWLESEPRNGAALVKFLKGLYKGFIYCRDNEKACADMVAPTATVGDPVQQRWAMHEVNKLIWPAAGNIGMHNLNDMKATSAIAKEYGHISEDVPLENHTTDRYTIEALKELELEGYDLRGHHFARPGFQAMLQFCKSGSSIIICEQDKVNPSIYIVIAACIIGIVALWTCLLTFKTRRLQKQVKKLTTTSDLDLESPLAKIIDFLRQYQSSRFLPWLMPTREEAGKLLVSVIANSGNLTAPDIADQLHQHPKIASDMLRFLQSEYGNQPWSYPGSQRTKRLSSLSDLTFSIGQSLHKNPAWGDISGASLHGSTSRQSSEVQLTVSEHAVEVKPDLDHRGGFGDLNFEDMTTPAAVAEKMGRDLFLDFVSQDSPLKDHKYPLVMVVKGGLQALELERALHKESMKFLRYAAAIQEGYATDLYHSVSHACDVTNRFISLISATGFATCGDERKGTQACLMIAGIASALIHDYKHPQVNNHFLSETGTDLAVEFNDQAVAENYSIKQGLLLLQNPSLNFIESWQEKHKKLFRQTVIQTVLATDMTRHYDIVSQFTTRVVEQQSFDGLNSAQKWLAMDTNTRMLTLQMTMKVADLGHCALPWAQHCEWVALLEEEFFQQGDKEREAELETSFLMDRNKPGANCSENQLGFFTVIAMPLFRAWCKAFPECNPLLQQAEKNFLRWQSMSMPVGDTDDSSDDSNAQQV